MATATAAPLVDVSLPALYAALWESSVHGKLTGRCAIVDSVLLTQGVPTRWLRSDVATGRLAPRRFADQLPGLSGSVPLSSDEALARRLAEVTASFGGTELSAWVRSDNAWRTLPVSALSGMTRLDWDRIGILQPCVAASSTDGDVAPRVGVFAHRMERRTDMVEGEAEAVERFGAHRAALLRRAALEGGTDSGADNVEADIVTANLASAIEWMHTDVPADCAVVPFWSAVTDAVPALDPVGAEAAARAEKRVPKARGHAITDAGAAEEVRVLPPVTRRLRVAVLVARFLPDGSGSSSGGGGSLRLVSVELLSVRHLNASTGDGVTGKSFSKALQRKQVQPLQQPSMIAAAHPATAASPIPATPKAEGSTPLLPLQPREARAAALEQAREAADRAVGELRTLFNESWASRSTRSTAEPHGLLAPPPVMHELFSHFDPAGDGCVPLSVLRERLALLGIVLHDLAWEDFASRIPSTAAPTRLDTAAAEETDAARVKVGLPPIAVARVVAAAEALALGEERGATEGDLRALLTTDPSVLAAAAEVAQATQQTGSRGVGSRRHGVGHGLGGTVHASAAEAATNGEDAFDGAMVAYRALRTRLLGLTSTTATAAAAVTTTTTSIASPSPSSPGKGGSSSNSSSVEMTAGTGATLSRVGLHEATAYALPAPIVASVAGGEFGPQRRDRNGVALVGPTLLPIIPVRPTVPLTPPSQLLPQPQALLLPAPPGAGALFSEEDAASDATRSAQLLQNHHPQTSAAALIAGAAAASVKLGGRRAVREAQGVGALRSSVYAAAVRPPPGPHHSRPGYDDRARGRLRSSTAAASGGVRPHDVLRKGAPNVHAVGTTAAAASATLASLQQQVEAARLSFNLPRLRDGSSSSSRWWWWWWWWWRRRHPQRQ